MSNTYEKYMEAAMAEFNQQHCEIIEAAGGSYVPGMMGDLVLFTSKQTGSTLAISDFDLTVDAVRRKIVESNNNFGIKGEL
jgi:hypothetical protein